MVNVPGTGERFCGVKVTLIEQLKPAPSEVPQVLVWAKSNVGKIAPIPSADVPVFVSVILCAGLVVPIG